MIGNVWRFSHTNWAGSANGRALGLRANAGLRLDGRAFGQRISSDNFDSRADAGVYSKNHSGIRGDFDFRSVDAENNGGIFHGNLYEFANENQLTGGLNFDGA